MPRLPQVHSDETGRYTSVSALARAAGVSTTAVYKALDAGRLDGKTVAGRRLVRRSDKVRRFVRAAQRRKRRWRGRA